MSSEQTATERLRALLDERGVEWETDRSGLRVMWGKPIDVFHDTMQYKAVDNALPNGGLNVHICGWTPEQAIAATLGSGRLTAEQVRDAMEDNSRQFQSPTDPYVWLTEYDHGAIADELNATMGRETCHITERNGSWYCDACDNEVGDSDPTSELFIDGNAVELWEFCPRCGRKVVE